MDEKEKDQITPETNEEPEKMENPQEEEVASPFGKLFSAWSNASEETVETIVSEKKEEATEAAETVSEKVEEVKTEVAEKVNEVKSETPVANATTSVASSEVSETVKKKKTGLIAGIAAAVVIVIILICIFTAKSTLTISDYATLNYEGVSGYASASLVIDWTKIEEDYGSKIKVSTKSSGSKELDQLIGAFSSMVTIRDVAGPAYSTSITPNKNLKNGDEVKVTFNLDKEYFESVTNGKIDAKELTFKVEGLEEAKEFNPFDDMELVWNGYSGEGSVEISAKPDSKVPSLYYRADKTYGLSNGEVIEFTIETYSNDLTEYCIRYGYIPTKEKMTMTVDALKEYEKVDLFKDVKVTFTGVSGYGKAEIDASGVKFETVNFNLDKTEGLKNGDVLVLKAESGDWWYDMPGILKNQGLTADEFETEIKVTGLEELKEYDPYSDIKIVYDGVSGYATASVEVGDKKESQYFSFRLDNTRNLSNDDEIVIEASMASDIDEFMDKFSVTPNLEPKTIKVEGLPHYYTQDDTLDDDVIKAMKSQAEDVIKGASSTWSNFTMDSIEYMGYVAFTEKDFKNGGKFNFIDIVYKVNTSYISDKKDKVCPYGYVRFYDVTVDPDGKCDLDVMNYRDGYSTNSYTYEHTAKKANGYESKTWTITGYETLEKLTDDVINSNREKYFFDDKTGAVKEDKEDKEETTEAETEEEETTEEDETEEVSESVLETKETKENK